MENLEEYTQDLRKMLTKALARRKNLLTYARHVAPTLPDREQAAKTLARHAIELDVLNAHIDCMQDEMKALKRQLADKGVNFTLKGSNPVKPRKKPLYRSTDVANGKIAFDDADKAQAFIAELIQRGYRFWANGKTPILEGSDFYGLQWCDSYEGKMFFITKRRDVYRTYSITK